MAKDKHDSIAQQGIGTLFVVASPIGNLADLAPRAVQVLGSADLILAEDTRRTAQLLHAAGLTIRAGALQSYHEHNERQRTPAIMQRLLAGASVALVSDAGTPLLSDPGLLLVAEAARSGCEVVAIPGPSALVAALSIAGLPTDRFIFEGFLPSKPKARQGALRALAGETRTLVFYEAPHRIAASLLDMAECFGGRRLAAVARELTKRYETVYRGTLAELAERARTDADMARGELVVVVSGAEPDRRAGEAEAVRVLDILLAELPASSAAKLAARITGRGRKELYDQALARANPSS